MTRDPLSLLAYEASRRPDVADMIARIDILTVEQIRASNVGLPWMRNAMLVLKQQSAERSAAQRMTGLVNATIVDGVVPESRGTIRRWVGIDDMIRVGRSSMQIKGGDLLWLPHSGGIWIDSIYGPDVGPNVVQNTALIGESSRTEYRQMVQTELQRGGPVPMTVVACAPEAAKPFSFQRISKGPDSW